MDDAVLVAALKYGFLALLALFVFFTVRTVAITLRVPPTEPSAAPKSGKPRTKAARPRSKAARPRSKVAKPAGAPKTPNVLIMRTGGKKVGTFKLKEGLTLGRDDGCDLRPPDDYLSQHHARFTRRDDAWFVEDLGSTNGTFLNGSQLTGPVEVRANDEVKAGTTTLELRR